MYRQQSHKTTSIKINDSYKGESIEKKVQRIMNNKEPITDAAATIYTDRKDGVMPEYNPRTDRFEVAIDAMDKADKAHKAKREQRMGERTYDTMTPEQQTEFNKKFPTNKHNMQQKNASGESTQGTK